VQDGALRLLALGDDGGSALFPDVPPLSRQVPGFDITGWFGICGPRGMAPAVIGRWEAALRQAMTDPAFVKRLAESGLTPRFEDAAALGARIAADRQLWRGVIQAVGVRAE
jgi:tripartite-type tricarboxylate transporter receptor subunit TctC